MIGLCDIITGSELYPEIWYREHVVQPIQSGIVNSHEINGFVGFWLSGTSDKDLPN